jgi:hypothetical protein
MGARLAISLVVGIFVGALAGYVLFRIALAKGFASVVASGESTSRAWLLFAFAALVFGAGAFAYTRGYLTRRAERSRLPEAKARHRDS